MIDKMQHSKVQAKLGFIITLKYNFNSLIRTHKTNKVFNEITNLNIYPAANQ
jgi:hypothetical protein